MGMDAQAFSKLKPGSLVRVVDKTDLPDAYGLYIGLVAKLQRAISFAPENGSYIEAGNGERTRCIRIKARNVEPVRRVTASKLVPGDVLEGGAVILDVGHSWDGKGGVWFEYLEKDGRKQAGTTFGPRTMFIVTGKVKVENWELVTA